MPTKKIPSSTAPLLAGYLTEDEYAAEIKKKRRTVRGWRRIGKGAAVTWVGRTPYYRIEAVHDWLLSREKKPPREYAGRRPLKKGRDRIINSRLSMT